MRIDPPFAATTLPDVRRDDPVALGYKCERLPSRFLVAPLTEASKTRKVCKVSGVFPGPFLVFATG